MTQPDQSMLMQQENSLEALQEERDEDEQEDNTQIQHQTLNIENDMSALHASQDIEPHNSSQPKLLPTRKDLIKIEDDQSDKQQDKAKTWQDKDDELNLSAADLNSGRPSKSLLNFVQYMEDEEARAIGINNNVN